MSALVPAVAVPVLAPLGAFTFMDALGPLAMCVGVLMIGLLLVGIGVHFSKRRR